jgi:hypothetical protein
MAARPAVLRVCELLNASGARYLVCGAQACILHVGLDGLIASKETYREQDAADRLKLLSLKRRA